MKAITFTEFQQRYDVLSPFSVKYAASRDERRYANAREYTRAQWRQYWTIARMASGLSRFCAEVQS